MRLAALRWWHWMAIALVVGLAVAAARDADQAEVCGTDVQGFGYLIADQRLFESALSEERDGRRRFTDITVYPRRIFDGHGGRRRAYLVAGRLRRATFTPAGNPDDSQHGTDSPVWDRACFIARVPYDPMIDLSSFNKPGGPDYDQIFRAAGTEPTVLNFLDTMHAASGVTYRYAWWDQSPWLTWPLASVVLVGLLWPILVNLITFGKLTRPREARGMSLWGVRRPRPAPATPSPAPAFSTPVAVAHGDEMPPAPAVSDDPSPPTPAPLSPVLAAPLPPPPVVPAAAKEFGSRPEDYYPTECHAPRHE